MGLILVVFLFFWLLKIYFDFFVDGQFFGEWCYCYFDCGLEELKGFRDFNGWGIKNEYLVYNIVKVVVIWDLLYVKKVINVIINDFDCFKFFNEYLLGWVGILVFLWILCYWLLEILVFVNDCMKLFINYIM